MHVSPFLHPCCTYVLGISHLHTENSTFLLDSIFIAYMVDVWFCDSYRPLYWILSVPSKAMQDAKCSVKLCPHHCLNYFNGTVFIIRSPYCFSTGTLIQSLFCFIDKCFLKWLQKAAKLSPSQSLRFMKL